MPTFDIYQTRETPNQTVPAVQKSYQPSANIENAGEQAIQAIDHIAKVWNEAEKTSQLTTATNNLSSQMLAFENDLDTVTINPGEGGDFYKVFDEKKKEYTEKLNKIKANSSTITNSDAKLDYTKMSDVAMIKAKQKIDTTFRNKMIEHQQVELVRSGDLLKNSFMSGDTKAKDIYRAQIEDNFDKGFIDEEKKYTLEQTIKDWDMSRVVALAEQDPTGTLDLIESGALTFDNAEDKIEAVKTVNQISNIKKATKALELANTQDDNQASFISQTEGMSIGQKLSMLKQGSLTEDYDSSWAKSMEARILSENNITAESRQDKQAEFLERYGILSANLDKNKGQQYLRDSKKLQADINTAIAKGELKSEDGDKIIESLSKNKGKAVEKLDLGATPFLYRFNDGVDFIKKNLEGEARFKAVIDYFYATDGQEKVDYKKKVFEVIDNVKQNKRSQVLDVLSGVGNIDEIVKSSSNNEYIKQEVRQDKKGNKALIGIRADGSMAIIKEL